LNNLGLNKDQGNEIIESSSLPSMKHNQTPSPEQISSPATPKAEEAHCPFFNSNPAQPADNILNIQNKDIITGDFDSASKGEARIEAPSSSLQGQDIEDSDEFEDEDSSNEYYGELNEDHQVLQE